MLVSTEEPIALIRHQDGEWRVLKNKKTRAPFGFSSVCWAAQQTAWSYCAASIACFLSVSLSLSFLLLPVVSTRAYTLQLTPTRTQTCLNYHHCVVFCLLSYQLLNRPSLLCLNTHKRRPSMEESFKYPLPPPPLQQKAARSSALSAGFWVMREKQRSSSQEEKCARFFRSASLCDQ